MPTAKSMFSENRQGGIQRMKRKLYAAMAVSVIGVLAGGPAHAGFLFGDETKGVTISKNESDLNVRIRLQPRFDFGDLVKDGTSSYASQSDLYLRRIRLELGGHLLTKTIAYNLTLTGDKWDKAANTNAIGIQYAFVKWLADDALVFTVGKEKLPFSRVSLTSSSKQLIVERPVSTEAAKKLFGLTDAYCQPKVSPPGGAGKGKRDAARSPSAPGPGRRCRRRSASPSSPIWSRRWDRTLTGF